MATRFRTEDVKRAVVAGFEAEAEAAAGPGGVFSRAERLGLRGALREVVDAVRADKGPGARVTAREVVDAYEKRVERALAAVDTRGPGVLSAAETERIADPDLRSRVWNVRAQATPPLGDDALRARMVRHVSRNVEPSPFARTGKAYPALNGGQAGLFAHQVTGPAAARLAELASLWNARLVSGEPDPFPGFDPGKQQLLAVRTSRYDDETLLLSAVDRTTGAVGPAFTMPMGQIFFFIGEADFTRLVGSLASFGATEYAFGKLDYNQVTQRVLAGSTDLDLGNPFRRFPAARAAAITSDAQAAAAQAGFPGLKVEVAAPVVAAQEALRGNRVTHAQAISRALDAFLTDTVSVEAPLSIVREAVMNEAGATTLTPALQAAADTRLRALLQDPATRLRALDLDEEPEGGEGPRRRWVMQLTIPNLTDHLHWALVDRAGTAPTTTIHFN